VIKTLRRALSRALGKPEAEQQQHGRDAEAKRRIDDARRRLKATIPPPED
jgi:hypothetical protein